MIRLLAMDTSTAACSVALLLGEAVYESVEITPRDHTRLILPMVEQLLSSHGQTLAQLDVIAFGRGPGSFTGLRICAGVVQGLALGAGLPVVSVSSLASVAHHALQLRPDALALVCMDARMGEVYFAAYERRAGEAVLLGREILSSPDALPLSSSLADGRPLLALGSGWQFLIQMPVIQVEDFDLLDTGVLPGAAAIGQLGLTRWRDGQQVQAHQAEPVYLRDQVAWKKPPLPPG